MDFKNREYIRDVQSGSDIIFQQELLIPNNRVLFPLLSQIANNFEIYRFNKLEFYWRSKTSDAGATATTNLGTVMLCIKYDVTLPPFTSKNEILNYEGTNSCRTTENMFIAAKQMFRFKWCKPPLTSASSLTADARNEALGTLTLAMQGQASANIEVGEMYVYYDITLARPKLYTSIGGGQLTWWATSSGVGVTNNNYMGTFFTNPTQTSIYCNTLNVTYPAQNKIQWNCSDGDTYYVTLTKRTIVPGVVATNTSTVDVDSPHIFIPYTINGNNAVYQSTPRVADFPSNLTTSNQQHVREPALTYGTYRAALLLQFQGVIKCRGNTPVVLTIQQNISSAPYLYMEHKITLIDRKASFPQDLGINTLQNSEWFQP